MRRLAVVGALLVLVLSAGCLGAIGVDVETETSSPDAGDSSGFDGEIGANASLEPVDAELSVHYIDVGQADATFVRGPENETMLIDSGHWSDGGEVVIEYLEARGVERIDYVVSTHAHADHIGGSAEVIDHYETERDGIGSVWDSGVPHTSQTYEDYLDAIERHDVDLYQTQANDTIPMEGATVEVLNPPIDHGDEDLDANAVVVRIGYGDAGFLFTGDMTTETEDDLVARWGSDLQSSILQAGHHGSSTSSAPEFLDTVSPRLAIVSSAYDSQYGHPHEEVLARFADRGIDTYWTGTHGTIVAGTDGDAVTISTVADARTDPADLRSSPAADASAIAPIEVRGTYDVGPDASALIVPAPLSPTSSVGSQPATAIAGGDGA
ncbi:putative hydrolase (metallo-beta-lactamase superfamily) protein [Salinarchaeum sp. Harcht-Bsk1]|uniref:ComEC/Rec2 family competence protein n=1 Tax=Salinarchaeum sp. Harcht-Bsk1 TaxID=1333523 RepID=UPI00034243EF|nr:ComEC/Rec2 family competence protein [Salinarchaeum sp. Harcht-Bsk1]AGN02622.1 putative hydrolase (metallo-beta-lactamase superfamily) protein [Salinarchaeum sp. Harcht-Bsk1]